MCALVATSMAGVAKNEKRSLLELGNAGHNFAHEFPAAPLVEAHHAPVFAAHHTHSVQRVNVPVPYAVEKIIEKIVEVDRPIPQPYPVEVVKHVPEPVHIDRPIPQVNNILYIFPNKFCRNYCIIHLIFSFF